MTEEVREELAPAERQEVTTNEQDTSEADFAAGFAAVMDEDPQEDSIPESKQEAKEDANQESAQEAPPVLTPEELIAQAKAEIYQELAKVRDTSAGRIGEVNQRMQQLLSQQQSTGQSGVKLTRESLKRLNAEFGEMAEMLAEDLSEALGGMGAAPQFDPEVINQRVQQEVAVVRDSMVKDMEMWKLSTVHPDWSDVVKKDEFRTWLAGKPLEYQDRINSSWDAREIAGALSSFKDETQRVQQQAQQRKTRLEAAITPTKATQVAPTASDADEFAAGFFKVAGKK